MSVFVTGATGKIGEWWGAFVAFGGCADVLPASCRC